MTGSSETIDFATPTYLSWEFVSSQMFNFTLDESKSAFGVKYQTQEASDPLKAQVYEKLILLRAPSSVTHIWSAKKITAYANQLRLKKAALYNKYTL